MLLNEQGVLSPLLEVELEEVAGLVAAEEALDQDGGTVAFEASLQSVNVHLQVELVLLRARLVAVVRDVPLHVLVQAPETVTERGVFDSLLVCDHVVVEGLQARDRVHDEVTVTWNGTDGVRE